MSVVEVGEPCDDDFLNAAEERLSVVLPLEVRRLYRLGDGRYRRDGEWWVVWPLDRLVADNSKAWSRGTLPRSLLAIGDDGTGNPFCVRLDNETVVRWSWIDQTVESMEGTLDQFLGEWAT
ncbi:MAG TPA: SMI1/KNR4 family protein [Acidimicrobiales bacterium]|nr:SMI1/KNR4 family protein [Acidimicrobiales bacterium]